MGWGRGVGKEWVAVIKGCEKGLKRASPTDMRDTQGWLPRKVGVISEARKLSA